MSASYNRTDSSLFHIAENRGCQPEAAKDHLFPYSVCYQQKAGTLGPHLLQDPLAPYKGFSQTFNELEIEMATQPVPGPVCVEP